MAETRDRSCHGATWSCRVDTSVQSPQEQAGRQSSSTAQQKETSPACRKQSADQRGRPALRFTYQQYEAYLEAHEFAWQAHRVPAQTSRGLPGSSILEQTCRLRRCPASSGNVPEAYGGHMLTGGGVPHLCLAAASLGAATCCWLESGGSQKAARRSAL